MKNRDIILDTKNDSKTGLIDRQVDKSENFKHKTSNQYKLLPFNTKWSPDCYNEFIYFNGILGEVYRKVNGKKLPKDLSNVDGYDFLLKERIIESASSKTETSDNFTKLKFEQLLTNLLFEGNNLFCFDRSILPYLSFKKSHATLKQISFFIQEIFLPLDSTGNNTNVEPNNNTNILYKLVKESLPKLEAKKTEKHGYEKWNKDIIELFNKDYQYLQTQERTFLSKIDLLLKHYYFIYISKVGLSLNDFCKEEEHPIFFLLETEIVSKNREGFRRGWNMLDKKLDTLFSHVNALELLNYIKVDGSPIGNYVQIKTLYDNMTETNQSLLLEKISELETYYVDTITKPKTGWEECYRKLDVHTDFTKLHCKLEKAIYRFWFIIDFQFHNTQRHKPYKDYSLWFKEFCKANFIKRRGRIGHTLKIDQEMLLFLTKLCIGKESKIRLKTLWEELKKRGVNFDESSKVEIVKLFEKINLIEKKSDSGDAQYIRTIL